MKGHPFSENRRAHIQQLIDIVTGTGTDGIMVATIQSIYARKYGNTKKTVESYLEDAENTGLILTDGVRWYGKDNLPRKKLSDYIIDSYVKKP